MKQKKVKNKEVSKKEVGISKRGKKIIFAGIIILLIGYFILTKTDPQGQNWASNLSPFIILGGYIAVGVGIIFPDKNEE